ncbi:thioredoxin domain-containing protein [candidate division KSB1 bacterium]|nr:thioredoxin domain-containing protein [candidate division KSB1 bacterium]
MHRAHTNALIHEASPYLLQHAHNPVNWLPWSDAAFERAERQARPVFLSVGYAACHWCHVMERECFENEEIAAYLNEHFVSIKVDREERPDVDHHYMSIVQSLSGSGGWPMSVFLTPQRTAFYGGTYWPAVSNYGRPGFLDVLRAVVEAWRNRRRDVEQTAGAIQKSLDQARPDGEVGELSDELIARALAAAESRFDKVDGGFGPAPKFPHAMELALLLRVGARTADADAVQIVIHSLRSMIRGGIFDQIGGGFHRYSTDARWLVPHFEKMLYDNALLIPLGLDSAVVAADQELREAARESLDWVVREMEVAEGGFASSLDADTDGEEGATYSWTPAEIRGVLGPERGARFASIYDIRDAGNFEHGRSVPNQPVSIAEWANEHGVDADPLRSALRQDRAALLSARMRRVQPSRDDKVLTDWNGMMISALVRGFGALDDPRYLAAATRAADRILTRFERTGTLPHALRGERTHETQFLLDHAAFGCGLLDLFGATGDDRWFRGAMTSADRMETLFARGAAAYVMSDDAVAGMEQVDPYDNATPSGISMGATLLVRLHQLTNDSRFRRRAERQLQILASRMERAPAAFGQALTAVDMLLHPPAQLVLVNDHERELWRVARNCPGFALSPLWIDPQHACRAPGLASLLDSKSAIAGKPTAYLCHHLSCEPPFTDASALADALKALIPRMTVN